MSQFPQKYEAVFNIVNKNMFREQQILEWFLKDHVTHFTVYSNRKVILFFNCIFDQINPALVSRRDIQKHEKNDQSQTFDQ